MLKKANAVLVIMFISLITASILNFKPVYAPNPPATIAVSPPEIRDPLLLPPEIFNVNITIDDVENLYGYEFWLDYNTNMLTTLGFYIHPIFNEQNYFPNVVMIGDDIGQIHIKVSYYSPANPISTSVPVTVVTLTFKVDNIGSSVLDLYDTKLWDPKGSSIDHVAVDGFVMTEIHDVAIINVVPSPTTVFAGVPVTINATAKNKGNATETFDVKAYYNSTLIGTQTITNLPPNAETMLTFTWDTTGVGEGLYTIKAEATTVPYEFNLTDNTYVDGQVAVMTRIRDLAILSVTTNANATYAHPLWPVNITVVAQNQGIDPETFDVTAYWNDTHLIGRQTVTNLAPNATTTLTFIWDTTNATICRIYKISANTTILEHEVDTADNTLDGGYVKVKIMGDLNGDGQVDIRDLAVLAKAFGSYPGHPRWDPNADLNKDNMVDIRDIAMAAMNFGKTCL